MVARHGRYHGEAFKATRGVTQGDIVSPTILNVVVDAVVISDCPDTKLRVKFHNAVVSDDNVHNCTTSGNT